MIRIYACTSVSVLKLQEHIEFVQHSVFVQLTIYLSKPDMHGVSMGFLTFFAVICELEA